MNLRPLTHDRPSRFILFLFFPLTFLLPPSKTWWLETTPFLVALVYND